VLAVGLLATAPWLNAAVIVWEDSNNRWDRNGHWLGGSEPGSGDIASFQDPVRTIQPHWRNDRPVLGIEFTALTHSWNIRSRNGGSIESLTIGSAGVANNSTNTQDFQSNNWGIILGANATFTADSTGATRFSADLVSFNDSGNLLTLSGTSTHSNNVIHSVISGSGGLTRQTPVPRSCPAKTLTRAPPR